MEYTLSSEGIELTDKLRKYVDKKVKPLEKFIPKHARESATLDIHFRLHAATDQKEVEFILVLPKEKIVVKEATTHAYASLDVIAVDVKRRLRAYKDKHSPSGLRHRLARDKKT
ncbi:MAG: putative sigma-54 modulation protein [Patescibacteria group bacterium]|nr:ribosome-associated translation inhibitor RaiA [Candidatus Saccharibacteria bacterium]MDQ5963597.1 putative sigma-54 modulation protein [Patescibacteria group bacterium]